MHRVEPGALLLVTEVAPYVQDAAPIPAGVHNSLSSAAVALGELAQLCDLPYQHCSSVESLPDDALETARILVLLTIGDTPWSAQQRETVVRRVEGGSLGLLGLHCATDASADWPEYGRLLGARFAGHPVTTQLPVAVVAADHEAVRHLPAVWHFCDEQYLFRDFQPDNEVVLAIRQGPTAGYAPGEPVSPADIPVAWARSVGNTRSFYTALGHFAAAWEDRNYLCHVLGALRFLLAAPAAAR